MELNIFDSSKKNALLCCAKRTRYLSTPLTSLLLQRFAIPSSQTLKSTQFQHLNIFGLKN